MTQASQRSALIAYLLEKVEVGDWHGVSDAANDLRVLEAQTAAAPWRTVFGTPATCDRCGWTRSVWNVCPSGCDTSDLIVPGRSETVAPTNAD
jgi:hypothetical protein